MPLLIRTTCCAASVELEIELVAAKIGVVMHDFEVRGLVRTKKVAVERLEDHAGKKYEARTGVVGVGEEVAK